MKREPTQRHRKQRTLGVSILTVTACADAVQPPLLLSREATTSLTLRGELTPARKLKRPVIVIIRRSDYGTPVSGRVFPNGPVLNVLVNIPPVWFGDALAIALSGHLACIEVTMEKLKAVAAHAVVGVRFATGELRSGRAVGMVTSVPSSQLAPPSRTVRVPPRKARRRPVATERARSG
jgi:hypothetical protein